MPENLNQPNSYGLGQDSVASDRAGMQFQQFMPQDYYQFLSTSQALNHTAAFNRQLASLGEQLFTIDKLPKEEEWKMKQDLMELVNQCVVLKDVNAEGIQAAGLYATELSALGFQSAARVVAAKIPLAEKKSAIAKYKYIAITPEKIQNFLNRKASDYNKANKKDVESHVKQSGGNGVASFLDIHSKPEMIKESDGSFGYICNTVYRGSSKAGTIGFFAWIENKIESYKGIPPKAVLENLREAKARNVFDYFTVATVNEVHDPLLIGRCEGLDEGFFLAQWGEDVCLDDLI